MAGGLDKNQRRVLEEARIRSEGNPERHVDVFEIRDAVGLDDREFLDVFRDLEKCGLVSGDPQATSRFNITRAGVNQATTDDSK